MGPCGCWQGSHDKLPDVAPRGRHLLERIRKKLAFGISLSNKTILRARGSYLCLGELHVRTGERRDRLRNTMQSPSGFHPLKQRLGALRRRNKQELNTENIVKICNSHYETSLTVASFQSNWNLGGSAGPFEDISQSGRALVLARYHGLGMNQQMMPLFTC